MIRVCDAIMSSGKSSACINYMNEHPDQKFIYITPYLSEAARIQKACPALNFVEPEDGYMKVEDEYGIEIWNKKKFEWRTKTQHTAKLIAEGCNITTTHQAFVYYTPDMLEAIRQQHYTLIVDEDVQAMSKYDIFKTDLDVLVKSGHLVEEDGEIRVGKQIPDGPSSFSGIFKTLESRNLIRIKSGGNKVETVFWTLPPDLFLAFDDVFILTYLFEGQSLSVMFQLAGIEYENIGIRKDEDGYHFDPEGTYQPAYVRSLANKIHICKKPKFNREGTNIYALSQNWLKNHLPERGKLRNHLLSFFRNDRHAPSSRTMWTTFKNQKRFLQGKGYTKGFVPLNQKATNEYSDRIYLGYMANLYLNPAFKIYYNSKGIEFNERLYALSNMIQWIFRSAIRNGDEIWIYIPSRRMRELLQDWIRDLALGGTGRESVCAVEEEDEEDFDEEYEDDEDYGDEE